MKDFIVEDRKAGQVVVEGKISEAGGVIVVNSSLDEGTVKGVISQISKDVASGKTRGRLGPGELDWVEVER